MYDLCHVGKNKNKLSPISPSMDGLWLFFVSPTWTRILREVDGISTCRSCSHSGILTLLSEGHCVEVDILKIIIGACKPANISGLTAQKWMISTRTFDISKYIYTRIYIYIHFIQIIQSMISTISTLYLFRLAKCPPLMLDDRDIPWRYYGYIRDSNSNG